MAEIVDYSITAGSNNAASPNGMSENMPPSGVNNTWREEVARHKRHWKDMDGSVTVGGTSTVMTATLNKGTTTLADIGPMILEFIASGSAPTLAVNGGTAKNLCWPDGTNVAANEIAVGTRALVLYDADKDKFVVMSNVSKAPLGGNLGSTDNAILRSDGTGGVSAQGSSFATLSDAGYLDISGTNGGMVVRKNGGHVDFSAHRTDAHGSDQLIASWTGWGADSGAAIQQYGQILMYCVDSTAGSEDSRLYFSTTVAGTNNWRWIVEQGCYTPNATGGDQGADTINASAIYDDGVQIRPEVLGTAVAMSGSSTTTYSSIPSGINWIEVSFDGISNSSTDNVLVQIGDSGGLETTGYTSASSNDTGTDVSSTAGFIVHLNGNAANVLRGTLRIVRSTGNVWVSSHSAMLDQDEAVSGGGARTTLDSALDRVAILSTAGHTFDAGTVNVRYG